MNSVLKCIAAVTISLGMVGAATAQQDKPAEGPAEKPAESSADTEAPPMPEPVHSKLTLLPSAFTSFGAAAQGGYIYLVGGHTAPAHQYSREGFQTGFWRLSLADRTSWEQLPGGVSLQSVALVSDGKRLIRLGGMTARNAVGEPEDLHSTTEVEAYDPALRAWAALPPLPELRSSHDAAVLDGKLFVFGGWKLDGKSPEETPWHDSGLVLDLNAEKPAWEKVSQPFARRAIAMAATGGRVYAIGGMASDGKMTGSTDIYDVAAQKWSKGPDLPGFAFGSSATAHESRVYATTFEGWLYSHAAGEAEWKRECALTFPRMFHRLVAANGQIAAIAGTMRGGHLRNLEWLRPGNNAPVLTHVSMPAPGNAKVRQGIFMHQGSLYVFGGNNSTREHQFKADNFLDEAWRLRLTDFTASPISKLPMQRQSFITLMTGTGRDQDPQGFALGGFGFSPGAENATSQDEILGYSITDNEWRKLDVKLPLPMTQFSSAIHGEKVYLFGGMDFDRSRGEKGQFKLSSKIWVWDRLGEDKGARQEFRALEARLGQGRRAFAGAEMDGKFYVVGGMSDRFEEVESCEVFDFATGKCEEIPAPADVRIAGKLVPLGGKLYLVGGTAQGDNGLETCRHIDMYDPATRTWTTVVKDIGFNPGELQAMVFGRSLLIYSAHNEDGALNFLFVTP